MWNTIDSIEDLERWRRAGNYWSLRASLRSGGRNLIFFGLMFSVLFAFIIGSDAFLTIIVPLLIGLPLLVVGVLLIQAPHLSPYISYAILGSGLIVNGIIIMLTEMFPQPGQGTIPIPLFIVQIVVYGWFSFQLWSASKSLSQDVPAADVAQIDHLVKELRRANVQRNPEYIAFSDSVNLYHETITGKLGEYTALFLFQRQNRLFFVRKAEIDIVNAQPVRLHKEVQAVLRVARESLTIFIRPELLKRFQHWKGSV
ncbi:MAG: hypothetical protein ACLFVO_06785 [Chloroflexaceae bacterium]